MLTTLPAADKARLVHFILPSDATSIVCAREIVWRESHARLAEPPPGERAAHDAAQDRRPQRAACPARPLRRRRLELRDGGRRSRACRRPRGALRGALCFGLSCSRDCEAV